MSDEYKEEKKADFRLKLAQKYHIIPVINDFYGFFDSKKVDKFRIKLQSEGKWISLTAK